MDIIKIKRNQILMIQDRGYRIPEEEEDILSKSRKEIIRKYKDIAEDSDIDFRSSLNMTYWSPSYRDKNGKKAKNAILAYYGVPAHDSKKLGVNSIRDYIENMKSIDKKMKKNNNSGSLQGVIITPIVLSSSSSSNISYSLYSTQVFMDTELSIRPLDHVFSPEYHVLDSEERKELLSKVSTTNLHSFISSYPIPKHYGWKPGTIVRITGSFDILEMSIIQSSVDYRIVR
jgi:DNA-directed RNA polymerase subunit H (RpoH/RPB5)